MLCCRYKLCESALNLYWATCIVFMSFLALIMSLSSMETKVSLAHTLWEHHINYILNSLRPSDTYMRHQARPWLVQIMACRLFGTKPLSEPMLYYHQMDTWDQTLNHIRNFHSRKWIRKCHLKNVSASMCWWAPTCWSIWSICNIIWKHAMLHLPSKVGVNLLQILSNRPTAQCLIDLWSHEPYISN